MSFFSKKPEINYKDFCRNIYDNQILDSVIEGIDFGGVFPDYVKKSLAEVDLDFAKVDLLKLKSEIITLRFELFASAWLHKFGEMLAIAQSIFTKKYLQEKGRVKVWNEMDHYNKGISHSTTVGFSEEDKAFMYKTRADLADKHIANADKKGITVDESIGRVINRMFSQNAWEKKTTSYFLMLGLCHRLGLGYGANYFGPKEEAQNRLIEFIIGLYDGAKQSFEKIKILA